MKFELIDRENLLQWDDFVRNSPQGSIFSTSTFLDALSCNYRVGAVTNQGNIMAGIVLTQNEIKAFSNPLFAKYLGVLLSPPLPNSKYVNQFARERKMISFIVDNLSKYRSFDYTFHPSFKNWLPFFWSGYQQETRYTYCFTDISDMKEIRKNVHSRVKNDLRKAEDNNILFTKDVGVEEFYRVNSLSFQRQGGTPPYSLKKIGSMINFLKEKGTAHLLGTLDSREQLLAVAGVINDEKSSYLIFNGIDHTKPNVGGNTKLIMDTIDYCSTFTSSFDFEGSMIKGVESFYQSFGAEQVPYFSIGRRTWQVGAKKRLVQLVKKIKYHR